MKNYIISMKKLLLVLLMLLAATTYAGDIDKAYKALNSGDYTNAIKFLREVLQDDYKNAMANYGMARFYFLKDNKANNLDSANFYIKEAAKYYINNPDNKDTKKALTLGVRDFTIKELLKSINVEAYNRAEAANTPESYQFFLDSYTDEGLRSQATRMRNQRALILARGKNDYKALADFVQKYPNADEIVEVKEQYEKLLFDQITSEKTMAAYKKYMDEYPMGKYVVEAKKQYNEALFDSYVKKNQLVAWIQFDIDFPTHPRNSDVQDTIYKLATSDGSIEAYRNFIRGYKKNKNIPNAWNQLYLLYTASATEDVYNNFALEFRDYPNKDRLKVDLEFSKLNIKPFQRNGKWGYAEQPRPDSIHLVIPFEFEEALEFSGGLAAVRTKPCTENKCTYFYIDKGANRVFKREFNYAGNFDNGFAIVGSGNCESEDSCFYGIIDKRGEYIADPEYDVIEDASEGYYLASKNGKFGYLDRTGEEVISMKYSDGLPFSQGVAAVSLDGNWFFIDNNGRQLFINRFTDVSSFKDSLCAVTLDGVSWGYVDMRGELVIPTIYESAEDFNGGFAIISKKEKDTKMRDAFISQRYKIDKAGKVIEKITAPKVTTAKSSTRKAKK
jgi:hypothetical protein